MTDTVPDGELKFPPCPNGCVGTCRFTSNAYGTWCTYCDHVYRGAKDGEALWVRFATLEAENAALRDEVERLRLLLESTICYLPYMEAEHMRRELGDPRFTSDRPVVMPEGDV